MTREQAIAEAVAAAGRAKELAEAADRDLNHPNLKHETLRLTAASTAYSAASRAYAALAAALPATTEETNRG
jgi:predicted metal-dependent hydrolase